MDSAGQPCLKLLIKQIVGAAQDGGFAFEGLRFTRVWVQGTVKQKIGSSFRIDDGTGDVLVASTISPAGQDVEAGSYALVVGKLVAAGKSQSHIKAHKVVNLSADPESVGQRMMHWNAEVVELQRKVYPLLAAQQ